MKKILAILLTALLFTLVIGCTSSEVATNNSDDVKYVPPSPEYLAFYKQAALLKDPASDFHLEYSNYLTAAMEIRNEGTSSIKPQDAIANMRKHLDTLKNSAINIQDYPELQTFKDRYVSIADNLYRAVEKDSSDLQRSSTTIGNITDYANQYFKLEDTDWHQSLFDFNQFLEDTKSKMK